MKFLFVGFLLTNCFAKFYLEAGGSTLFSGTFKDEITPQVFDFSGTSLHAKLGAKRMGLMIGMSARQETLDIDRDLYSNNFTSNLFGGFIGYEMPSRVRVYAEYFMDGTGEIEDYGDFNKPSGYAIGFGYRFFRHLSFHVESVTVSYEELTAPSGEVSKLQHDVNYIAVGLSIPLEIGNI